MPIFSRIISRAADIFTSSAAYHSIGNVEFLASRSHFLRACRVSPGGYYPLELVYLNRPQGSSLFEHVADAYYLNAPLARAARSRLTHSIQWLRRNAAAYVEQNDNVRILSLACGGARDVCSAFSDDPASVAISYLGIDIDQNAIDYAQDRVEEAGLSHFLFEQGNALRPSYASGKSFDLIVTLGLFDYLTDGTIKTMLNRLYPLLPDGGRLLFGAVTLNPSQQFFEKRLGWRLRYRSADQILSLAQSSAFSQVTVASASKDRFLLVECIK